MLVDADDLATYMDLGRFNNRQEANADIILEGVQAEIASYLRRPVEPEEFIEVYTIPEDYLYISPSAYFYDRTLDVTADSIERIVEPPYTLHLRQSPVSTVEEVRVKGRAAASWTTLTAGTQYVASRWGIDMFSVQAFDQVEVTYTAGLEEQAQKYIRLLILRVASREMQNLTDDVVGLKDLNTREVAVQDVGLTERDLMVLKRWRRRQI